MHKIKGTEREIALTALDIEKAFITLEYMLTMLLQLGFGPNLIGWIQLLHTKLKAQL